MANIKQIKVRAPEGYLDYAMKELGYKTKQEMFLRLMESALYYERLHKERDREHELRAQRVLEEHPEWRDQPIGSWKP